MAGKNIMKTIKDSLSFLDNPIILGTIIVLLILYSVGVIPMLTHEVAEIFDNVFVKIFIILVILYIGIKNAPLAVIIAIAFILSLRAYDRHREYFDDMEGMENMDDIEGVQDKEPDQAADVEQDDDEKKDTVEGMAVGKNWDKEIIGSNYEDYAGMDCVKDCAEGKRPFQCEGYSRFGKDSMNAQGMGCPMGSFDKDYGSAPY